MQVSNHTSHFLCLSYLCFLCLLLLNVFLHFLLWISQNVRSDLCCGKTNVDKKCPDALISLVRIHATATAWFGAVDIIGRARKDVCVHPSAIPTTAS